MSVAAESARPLAARLWTYQAERFPLVKHGLLIAAFAASGVCVSALLRGATPDPAAIGVAIVVLFGFFLQLRVADEHKDHEDDRRFRPERPVPRGLVTLAELRAVAIAAAAIQIAATLALHPPLLALLALVWAWMALMSAEFFVPAWLKARPVLYLVSHMAIMPLIDLYATAADWLPAGAHGATFGFGLGAFLALSFANGAAIEIARKSWAPEDEREGVDTYSKLWGRGHAAAATGLALAGGLLAALIVAHETRASALVIAALLLAAGAFLTAILGYVRATSPRVLDLGEPPPDLVPSPIPGLAAEADKSGADHLRPQQNGSRTRSLRARSGDGEGSHVRGEGSGAAKRLETFAGLWVLVSYLALGVAPAIWAALA